MDPEAPNLLHHVSRRAHWSRANEKGVFPGVSTVLNWSIWGEIGERGTRRAAFELGLFTQAELDLPESVDDWMWSIFYGRPSANVDSWRRLYELGLTSTGSGAQAQQQVFGAAPSNRSGAPTPDRRAFAAEKRPAALARATEGMRAHRIEAQLLWREATAPTNLRDAARSPQYLASAIDLFERADPFHIMVSLFATEAVTDLASAAERAGMPDAPNALMVGYPGMEEFQTTLALWELSRGRLTLAEFLASHGFHGAQEGEIASVSWRERSESIESLARKYALLCDTESPIQREALAVETRSRVEGRLRAALPAAERAALDDVFARAAIFLPLREAGRATLTIALDAMRAHVRVLGRAFAQAGAIANEDDVFLLTRQEILDLPTHARERIEERRALRAVYESFELPETWQGTPGKIVRVEAARGESIDAASKNGGVTALAGLGASAGIHEGVARVVLDARELGGDFDPGDVLVAPATDPSWAPFFLIAGAVVIDTGSNISHAAVVAREMGIPAVVGVTSASTTLRSGQRLRVDGSRGTVEVLG